MLNDLAKRRGSADPLGSDAMTATTTATQSLDE
jgi:hypothetical protein